MGKRVIKFKRYYQHDETGRITFQFWGKLDLHDNSVDDFGSFKSPTYMHRWFPFADCQFTGIYDKNGKEIYEGDLLEIPVNEAIREGVHRIYYFKDGFVSSSIFFKEDETANKSSLTWIINRGAFVIGNIFENPELLTNEQTD